MQTAMNLLSRFESGEVTSEAVTAEAIAEIESRDGTIGVFLEVFRERALTQARSVDARRKKGERVGKLAGVPIATKDIFSIDGEIVACASKMLRNYRAPYNATVIEKLLAEDAVLIGRVNMDEFAMGGSTENSALGKTLNPRNHECVPGGSSGGSAAAVAAEFVPLALGTDTGGSIRQPAAFCGVVGLKPTYGRVSRYGVVAFASSLDQVGPIAQTAEDAALLLEVIAGHDPKDSTSLHRDVPQYIATVNTPIENLRIGYVREHFAEGLDAEIKASVKNVIEKYRSLGASVKEVSLPHSKYSIPTYYIISSCEASSNLARYDGMHYGFRDNSAPDDLIETFCRTRSAGFGAEVKRRILLGTYALSSGYYDAYYLKALKVRRLIRDDFDRAFQEVDVIVGPTTPVPPFKIGDKIGDPLSLYLCDLYTCSVNLAGIPAISVPCGQTSDGLPIGVQLHAPPLQEERLFRAARMIE
ncbi:MAG: Asp-tRNA(Asn)/Glu-tRNA(Gln) amidotransferase subunit GatA [Planctomycetaceae bacterium]|jgi:aspartyl-tRNA(Asn)/glutamyl-tRNA(Gln) amidotransferase subunit A|nr:Asp-tRNA(Asn)/Glu-tRNA(Gln) amidotransferase subunit GatA [Planctomycetaceae bacterium]